MKPLHKLVSNFQNKPMGCGPGCPCASCQAMGKLNGRQKRARLNKNAYDISRNPFGMKAIIQTGKAAGASSGSTVNDAQISQSPSPSPLSPFQKCMKSIGMGAKSIFNINTAQGCPTFDDIMNLPLDDAARFIIPDTGNSSNVGTGAASENPYSQLDPSSMSVDSLHPYSQSHASDAPLIQGSGGAFVDPAVVGDTSDWGPNSSAMGDLPVASPVFVIAQPQPSLNMAPTVGTQIIPAQASAGQAATQAAASNALASVGVTPTQTLLNKITQSNYLGLGLLLLAGGLIYWSSSHDD